MKHVGIDLHKKTIVLCVVNKERAVLERKTFAGTVQKASTEGSNYRNFSITPQSKGRTAPQPVSCSGGVVGQ